MNTRIERDARSIIDAAINAVLPDEAVKRALDSIEITRPATIMAIGKAAWRMASAAYARLGAERVRQGIVVTKYRHAEGEIGNLEIIEAGHPVPDENSVAAASRLTAMARTLTDADTVILLLSGGGSALFELPAEGVTLCDIADVTDQLLRCGADIREINCVRKRLSAVKGGRLAQMIAPANVYAIVLSDVLGDPLDVIASGPAAPDLSTCAQAEEIARRYRLRLSASSRAALAVETPKALPNVRSYIAGNVSRLCEAAAREAERLGYASRIENTAVCDEARALGLEMATEIRSKKPPCALIWGGETVVKVVGDGKGGRNQEVALSAARGIAGMPDTCVFAVGSDGTDGPTDAAGGIVTGEYAARAGVERIEDALQRNDAYTLLHETNGLIMTGPTGTNVNDLYVALRR